MGNMMFGRLIALRLVGPWANLPAGGRAIGDRQTLTEVPNPVVR